MVFAHFLSHHSVDVVLVVERAVVGQYVAPAPVFGIILGPATRAGVVYFHTEGEVRFIIVILVQVVVGGEFCLQGQPFQQRGFQIGTETEILFLVVVGADFGQCHGVVGHVLVVRTVIGPVCRSDGGRRLRLQGSHDNVIVGTHFLLAVRHGEVDTSLQPALDLSFQIASQGETFEAGSQSDTRLIQIACTECVGHFFLTACDGYIMAGHQGVAIQLVLPVGSFAQ